jgi:hypothetical protein
MHNYTYNSSIVCSQYTNNTNWRLLAIPCRVTQSTGNTPQFRYDFNWVWRSLLRLQPVPVLAISLNTKMAFNRKICVSLTYIFPKRHGSGHHTTSGYNPTNGAKAPYDIWYMTHINDKLSRSDNYILGFDKFHNTTHVRYSCVL